MILFAVFLLFPSYRNSRFEALMWKTSFPTHMPGYICFFCSIPAFPLDCLILTMTFYLILSRLGLPILLFWTQYEFSCHLNYYLHYVILAVKITEPRLLYRYVEYSMSLTCSARSYHLPPILAAYVWVWLMTQPHCQDSLPSILLAKIFGKNSIITGLITFSYSNSKPFWLNWDESNFSYLFSTHLMSPTKPLWESIIYCSDIRGLGFTCSPFPWLSYIRLYVSQGQR